jgi:para-aminobenzoate synthetase/4-amino-4-deoxychorismate lyase
MKGTAARHPEPRADACIEKTLKVSAKNAAENVMIVDMIRNDLGRIAHPGSVRVSSLFSVEKYPTVFQATSTVRGRTKASLLESLDALFPCASVTGAPKVETMKIIRRLEMHPRGAYTGAIGYVSPDRASFNVGIRTLDIARDGSAIYGTGSGIVWESDADSEYDECLAKSSVLFAKRQPFELLETMLWEKGRGYSLSAEHIERVCRSAAYFGFPITKAAVRRKLSAFAKKLTRRSRVRLLVSIDGKIKAQSKALPEDVTVWKVGVAKTRADSRDCFLYHKTTHRKFYDAALAEDPSKDDMILFNERGELTESCKANIVVVLGRTHFTPPVASGLLAGTLRERMIKRGELRERVLTRRDMLKAKSIYLINSVRGRIPIVLEGIS